MRHVLRYNGIVSMNGWESNNRYNGSSRYGSVNMQDNMIEYLRFKDFELVKNEQSTQQPPPECSESNDRQPRAPYTLDVKKFRSKVYAYTSLSKSLKFLAFYSISFPIHTSDDECYRIWNIGLSRLRREYGLKSYIWVMERQDNGTIHYHMLTNDWMPIKKVNHIFAAAIDGSVSKGRTSWGNSSLEKYNGVDVHNMAKNLRLNSQEDKYLAFRNINMYMTKYLSKQIQSSSHYVWHCSRLVSALFTSVDITEGDMHEIHDRVLENNGIWRTIECDYATFTICSTIKYSSFFEYLNIINDKVYEYFELIGDW